MTDIGGLYQFVLALVLVGVVVAVGLIVLDKLAGTSGISSTAITALNATMKAIADIPNLWLGLLVTIVILGIILAVIINTLGNQGR